MKKTTKLEKAEMMRATALKHRQQAEDLEHQANKLVNEVKQLEQALTHVRSFIKKPSHKAIMGLRQVLSWAQNQPPDGGADGSIDFETWKGLKQFSDTAWKLVETACTLDADLLKEFH